MTRISARELSGTSGPFGRGVEVVRPASVPEGSVVSVLRVPPEAAGMRLDRFVQSQLKRTSRTRAQQIIQPVAVVAGGLPGWRYRYTFGTGATAGAHDHYFLFKGGRLIQLVFQAVPAERLPAVAPLFDSIAASFRGHDA